MIVLVEGYPGGGGRADDDAPPGARQAAGQDLLSLERQRTLKRVKRCDKSREMNTDSEDRLRARDAYICGIRKPRTLIDGGPPVELAPSARAVPSSPDIQPTTSQRSEPRFVYRECRELKVGLGPCRSRTYPDPNFTKRTPIIRAAPNKMDKHIRPLLEFSI